MHLNQIKLLLIEPRKPGAIVTNLSNFSADGVHFVWEESDGFVNRYIVRIDDHEQETLDKKPTIDWDQLLLPDTLYNVTITAISYGFSTNYHSFGRRLSVPAIYWIETSSVICKLDYTFFSIKSLSQLFGKQLIRSPESLR